MLLQIQINSLCLVYFLLGMLSDLSVFYGTFIMHINIQYIKCSKKASARMWALFLTKKFQLIWPWDFFFPYKANNNQNKTNVNTEWTLEKHVTWHQCCPLSFLIFFPTGKAGGKKRESKRKKCSKRGVGKPWIVSTSSYPNTGQATASDCAKQEWKASFFPPLQSQLVHELRILSIKSPVWRKRTNEYFHVTYLRIWILLSFGIQGSSKSRDNHVRHQRIIYHQEGKPFSIWWPPVGNVRMQKFL